MPITRRKDIITLVGFDMNENTAQGKINNTDFSLTDAGYYFVLQERPGQLRFGLDNSEVVPSILSSWYDLNWEHLNHTKMLNVTDIINGEFAEDVDLDLVWGNSSADMASILIQQPVLFLMHATAMI